jgi:hypothetical protein
MAGFMSKKVGGIPMPAIIGLGVAAGGVVLYLRKKNAATAAAAASSSGTAAAAPSSTAPVPAVNYGQTGQDNGALMSILAAQGAGATGTTSTNTLQNYVAPQGQDLFGAGYGTTPDAAGVAVTGSDGSQYVQLASPTQLVTLQQQGTQLYYQPIPGMFSPMPPNGAAPNTPVWVKQQAAAA